MEFLGTIVNFIVGFLSFVLVLRAWFQFCRVDAHLPISQSLLRLTEPMVAPIAKVIPTIKNINFAALLIAMLLITLKFVLFDTNIALSVLIGLLGIIKTLGEILFYATIIRALMSWVTQGTHPLDYVIAQITEPVLGLIRRMLPRTGMLDFSVMIFIFLLYMINTAFYNLFGMLWAVA